MTEGFIVRNSKTGEEYGGFHSMDAAERFMLSLFDARYFALYRRMHYKFSGDGMYTVSVHWTERKNGEEYSLSITEIAA